MSGTLCRNACARIEVPFQGCFTAIRPAGSLWMSMACSNSARAGASGSAGCVAQRFLQGFGRRQSHAVFAYEPAQAAAISFVAQRAGQQRQMNAAPRLVPGAERAGRDILAHALLGAPEKRQFPIVNRPRAVGGEVRHPAARHKRRSRSPSRRS